MMIGHLDKVEKTSEYTVTEEERESFRECTWMALYDANRIQWRNGFLGGLALETRDKI